MKKKAVTSDAEQGGELHFLRLHYQITPLLGAGVIWANAKEGSTEVARANIDVVHQVRAAASEPLYVLSCYSMVCPVGCLRSGEGTPSTYGLESFAS